MRISEDEKPRKGWGERIICAIGEVAKQIVITAITGYGVKKLTEMMESAEKKAKEESKKEEEKNSESEAVENVEGENEEE